MQDENLKNGHAWAYAGDAGKIDILESGITYIDPH